MTKAQKAILKAVDCLYVPYIWGGNDPDEDGGVDCSGFIGHVLKHVNLLPENYDKTAQGYMDKFAHLSVDPPYMGCLAFYGKRLNKITHVMLCINQRICIGAVRGNKWCVNAAEAKRRGARIDIRETKRYRKDLILLVDPFKETENA